MARSPRGALRSPKGFRWAGVRAGIKQKDAPDLALLVTDAPASAAAIFTTNVVAAAPVLVAREQVRRGRVQAVLVNSGNANACTGREGVARCRRSVAAAARALGVSPGLVFPASTGVIGQPLPVDKMAAAMPRLIADVDARHIAHFADAILTTDQWRKTATATVPVGRERATVTAIAKGAGMIHPNMATTLAFVVTDAAAAPATLRRLLRGAAAGTFNAISVDGDTSTNDTLLAVASGAVGQGRAPSRRLDADLGRAFEEVLGAVGELIVADGEGAEHVVRIEVTGLRTDAEARAVARTVATSPLVKTALHGKDPNWGRILAAAGRAGVRFDPAVVALRVGGVGLVRRGEGLGPRAEARVAAVMRRPKYAVELALGRGPGRAHYLTCDLGHAYVNCNADYRT